MSDPVYVAFLREAQTEATCCNAESDIVRLVGEPRSGNPPSVYHGLLREVEHLLRGAHQPLVSRDPIPFTLRFPEDYLRSVDPNLQFRVARVHVPLLHPNVRGGLVCLGPRFRPGTRLRALVEHLYAILASRAFATDHAFCEEARDYYRGHTDEVRALRARPLFRRRVAARVRVERIEPERAGEREERP